MMYLTSTGSQGLPSGEIDGTFVLMAGSVSLESWTTLTTHLSHLLGGTMVGLPMKPFPLLSTANQTFWIETFPDAKSHPSSVNSWLQLLPRSQVCFQCYIFPTVLTSVRIAM